MNLTLAGADESAYAALPSGTQHSVDQAANQAAGAFWSWSKTTA